MPALAVAAAAAAGYDAMQEQSSLQLDTMLPRLSPCTSARVVHDADV